MNGTEYWDKALYSQDKPPNRYRLILQNQEILIKVRTFLWEVLLQETQWLALESFVQYCKSLQLETFSLENVPGSLADQQEQNPGVQARLQVWAGCGDETHQWGKDADPEPLCVAQGQGKYRCALPICPPNYG